MYTSIHTYTCMNAFMHACAQQDRPRGGAHQRLPVQPLHGACAGRRGCVRACVSVVVAWWMKEIASTKMNSLYANLPVPPLSLP